MALTKVSSGLISADAALVDLNIDAGTLYIDATNNRVGVRNQAPTVALEVTGDLVVSASATLGNTQVGQLTFSSLTNTTTDIPEGSKLFFTEQRVLDTAPGGSLSGTLGDVTVQYRTDGNYAGTAQQGSFYFDALNQRLKVYTGSEFIDTIPYTAGGGGGATTEANATFFKYQYTTTSETNNISGADIQEIESGAYVIGKSYEISVPGTTDFTALGAADNNIGTTFTATASGLVSAGNFVATEEYTIVSVDDGAGGATTDFTLIGAADNNIGTTFTATGVGTGTGTASQGSGTAHGILGYSTSSSTDVVVFVNGVKQRESTVDGYQATTGTTIAFTYNLPVDSIVDVQVYELLKNDAYYTKAQTYTQAEVNTQISTALSTYDDQTASDARYVNITGDTMTGNLDVTGDVTADGLVVGDSSSSFTLAIIQSSTSGESELRMGDTDTDAGSISYTNSDDTMTFRAAAAARMSLNSTGLDVTGTVTADGLTVDGNAEISGALPRLILSETDATDLNTAIRNNGGVFKVQTVNDAANSFTSRMDIDHSSGDISFYEDTGTTPKFFWDASAESLGIGTSSPASVLSVKSDVNNNVNNGILFEAADSTNKLLQLYENSVGECYMGFYQANVQTALIRTNGASYFNGGNVGIGVSSPTGLLTLGTGTFSAAAANTSALYTSTTAGLVAVADGLLLVDRAGADVFKVDTSGNLLVGTTDTTPYNNTTGGGFVVASSGLTSIARETTASNQAVLHLNNTGVDGILAEFAKDGTTVGSIASTDGTDLQIGSGNCYLRFDDATNQILPTNAAGALRDNTVDLGEPDSRFKDVHAGGRGFFNLYSSGINSGNIMVGEGVYVGAANGDNQIRSSSAGGGSATLYIGNAAIQVSSDQRLKTNIVDTEMNATEKLNQVRVVDFNWDDPSDTSFNNRNARGKWTGVLAQELVDVLPFAVNAPRHEEDLSIDEESDQKWLVDQAQMVPVLIKAIQELTARIAALEGAN